MSETQTRILPPAEARAVETVHRDMREAMAAYQALAAKFAGKLQPLGGGAWAEVTQPSEDSADG
jgi:hypothetical protein